MIDDGLHFLFCAAMFIVEVVIFYLYLKALDKKYK